MDFFWEKVLHPEKRHFWVATPILFRPWLMPKSAPRWGARVDCVKNSTPKTHVLPKLDYE